MASYYVNLSASTNGGGTSASDAFNSMASLPTLAAGDVVEITPGSSQTMSAAYTVSASGASAANPITIRANPALSGAKPILRVVSEGGNGIICTGKSYVTIKNIVVTGDASWTSQNTVGVLINGSCTDIRLEGVECRYCRYDLVGGFATNGVTLTDCEATDNPTDGVRMFSGAGTYTWQNITISGGVYSRNGVAAGANGAGISIYIQPGHTGTTFQNLEISRAVIQGNYRNGIGCNDASVAWATTIAAGNTTPPTRQIKGVWIKNNRISGNGGAGISLQSAQPSATRGVLVQKNVVEDNSTRSTLGSIWTGGCLTPVIEKNICRRASSNGTTVGDGCGIFDDQWNSGAIVRYNVIQDNEYQSANPTYTAYGIGIYRSSGGQHYSNLISGCRHGFVIGYLSGATAPVMSGISIYNNTIANTSIYCFSVWSDVPSSALTVKNNFLLGASQDIEAHSGTAGSQTFASNAAANVTTKYTGNSVGAGAFDHTIAAASSVTAEFRPKPGSSLLGTGVHMGYLRDVDGKQRQNPPSIGAYDAATMIPG